MTGYSMQIIENRKPAFKIATIYAIVEVLWYCSPTTS